MTTQNVETKSFHVSGWQGKRNKQLAKLNKEGWELVQLRLMFGAGTGVAFMQRTAQPKASNAAVGLAAMASLTDRMNAYNNRERIARQAAARERRAAKDAKAAAKAKNRHTVADNG